MGKVENNRRYRERHKEQIAERNRTYYLANKESVLAKNREYASSHSEETTAYKARWYQENKERIVENQRKWKLSHPDEQLERERRYVDANREERYSYMRQRRARNRDYIRSRLSGLSCEYCGGSATDWHHTDQSKKYKKLAAMSVHSIERIDAEIGKCIPLCRSCHSKHHAELRRVDVRRLS